MKRWVVDASVAIKWFLPDAVDEANTAEALDLLLQLRAGAATFHQPPHWKAEIAAVLVRRAPHNAAASLNDLGLLEGVESADAPDIYHLAIDLAHRLGHHLFDTLYHATALNTGATLLTADRRYYDKAAHLGSIALLARQAA